jgi:hypothetical protein
VHATFVFIEPLFLSLDAHPLSHSHCNRLSYPIIFSTTEEKTSKKKPRRWRRMRCPFRRFRCSRRRISRRRIGRRPRLGPRLGPRRCFQRSRRCISRRRIGRWCIGRRRIDRRPRRCFRCIRRRISRRRIDRRPRLGPRRLGPVRRPV